MYVPKEVQRCAIFHEFSAGELQDYFGLHDNKTLHHIDTLYYSVYLNEPKDVLLLQDEDRLPQNLRDFLSTLKAAKNELRASPSVSIDFGCVEGALKSFSMYEYCVSLPECFDIFISSYLPTEDTPRIVVQLRSRYLVMEGVMDAVEESFKCLKDFLRPFGLHPVDVRENRIDYAFHTNLIHNPFKFFADEKLKKHLKTHFRKGAKYFSLGEDIKIETLQLGNRKSNNVFFRAYNKCEEVIELNYKAFFIDRWRQNGLISRFDEYVYKIAYELGSYRTGVLVGRLKWYLEYGSNEELLDACRNLLDTNFVRSDNCLQLEKKLHNVIPEPTVIFNIEFQTKRKFYTTCGEYFDSFCDLSGDEATPVPDCSDPLLKGINDILKHGRYIVDYLTGYGNVVSFVQDRTVTKKQFLDMGEPYQYWWRRIRSTPIDYSKDSIIDLYRTYDVSASKLRSRRLACGQIARLAMLERFDTKVSTFEADIADALCFLNDNDVPPLIKNPEFEGKSIEPIDYGEIQRRKGRQMRGIIRKGNIKI